MTTHVPDPLNDLLADGRYSALIHRVRHFLRDYEEINRLNEGEESVDRDIAAAIMFTIDDINMTPPPVTKNLQQMVDSGWAGLIVAGAVIWLYKSLLAHYDRNNLKFNDGGLMTTGLSDRGGAIRARLAMDIPTYENYKTRIKVAANLQEFMSGSPLGLISEFTIIHGYGTYMP